MTLMRYDLEVQSLSLAAVLDFSSKNLILRSMTAGQVANGRRWVINGRIPVDTSYDMRKTTKSVVERALKSLIQHLSD
jgi:hypothetical protein